MPIDNSIVNRLHNMIGHRLIPYRHTALLVALVSLLGVRPLISNTGAGNAMYGVVVILVLMVAVYTIQVDELVGDRELLLKQRKNRGLVGWVLALVTLGLRMTVMVSPNHQLTTASSISLLLFFGFIALTELQAVLRQRTVTRETISMSISVYLLLGLTWGIFFIVLFDFRPHAFSFGGASPPSEQLVSPVLIYFSLTTLATVGYGDITPVTLLARYAAVTEGIAGQFYLAILVARLVGMQMSQSTIEAVENKVEDSDSR
jgi:voltage-gated potassium channel